MEKAGVNDGELKKFCNLVKSENLSSDIAQWPSLTVPMSAPWVAQHNYLQFHFTIHYIR